MASTTKARRQIGGTHKYLTDEQLAKLEQRAAELSGNLFTPRLRNGRRIGIVVDEASYSQIRGRGRGNRGVVTDLNTGNRYEIAGASCSLAGCVCDAIAIKISR
jgi:hypothetical protein